MDYTERLRHLMVNDASVPADLATMTGIGECGLDGRTLALARLAALVAIGGATPSYCEQVDTAIGNGATAGDIVDVLIALAPVIGLPRVIAAAGEIGVALGYDTEDALGSW